MQLVQPSVQSSPALDGPRHGIQVIIEMKWLWTGRSSRRASSVPEETPWHVQLTQPVSLDQGCWATTQGLVAAVVFNKPAPQAQAFQFQRLT